MVALVKQGRLSETETRLEPILSILVVNYESWEEVARLLAELGHDPSLTDGRVEVILVDNASPTSGPPVGLELAHPLKILRRPRNDGFAAGVNDGLTLSRGRWILLLNPDVEAGRHFASRLLDRIDDYERTRPKPPGIVGFRLLNPDGSEQPSVGVFPNLAWCLREAVVPRRFRKYQARKAKAGPVAWVTGACMLVQRPLFEALNGMDPDFFMYHEEVDFCRRAWNLGWQVEFDPLLQIVHLHPLQNREVPPLMRVITRHSKLLYFRKHLPRWQFEGLAGIVWVEALLRSLWARLRSRAPEHRAWQTVRGLPSRLRGPIGLKGTAVRELAETATSVPDRSSCLRTKRPWVHRKTNNDSKGRG